jgi:hypothetical protein
MSYAARKRWVAGVHAVPGLFRILYSEYVIQYLDEDGLDVLLGRPDREYL